MPEENVVFVGNKPVMNYVLAVVTQFNKDAKEVVIKARGKAISRAVDVSEIVKNRFMPAIKYKNIDLSTEELSTSEGSNLNVSAIEISLAK